MNARMPRSVVLPRLAIGVLGLAGLVAMLSGCAGMPAGEAVRPPTLGEVLSTATHMRQPSAFDYMPPRINVYVRSAPQPFIGG